MARMITNVSMEPSPMDHVTDMLKYFVSLPTVPYTDLTIQTEHTSIRVHSALLCSFSPMVSSILSPLPTSSPHPYLPGMSPTHPRISIPHMNKSCLPLARELLYTGYCKGTKDKMDQVVGVLNILGVNGLQLSMEVQEPGYVTNDTLELCMDDGVSIELEEQNMNELDENKNNFDDGEQVAVQEQGGIESGHQSFQADQYDEDEQFPAFLHDKFSNPQPEIRKSYRTAHKTPLIMYKRRQPDAAIYSFFCPHCHMKFTKLKDKEMHALLEHSYEQPFLCQECSARFKVKENIEEHMKLHGGGSYQVQCEVCDQVCKTMCQYHIHYKGHSGLKEFGCSKCGKSFTTFTNLKKHEEVHQPMRFSCDECGKMFHRKDNLKNHHKKHLL